MCVPTAQLPPSQLPPSQLPPTSAPRPCAATAHLWPHRTALIYSSRTHPPHPPSAPTLRTQPAHPACAPSLHTLAEVCCAPMRPYETTDQFEEASAFLRRFDTAILEANPTAAQTLRENGIVDLAEVAYKLSSTIPKVPHTCGGLQPAAYISTGWGACRTHRPVAGSSRGWLLRCC
jgi:hypothetical protein